MIEMFNLRLIGGRYAQLQQKIFCLTANRMLVSGSGGRRFHQRLIDT
jgi:hypothetical protein